MKGLVKSNVHCLDIQANKIDVAEVLYLFFFLLQEFLILSIRTQFHLELALFIQKYSVFTRVNLHTNMADHYRSTSNDAGAKSPVFQGQSGREEDQKLSKRTNQRCAWPDVYILKLKLSTITPVVRSKLTCFHSDGSKISKYLIY